MLFFVIMLNSDDGKFTRLYEKFHDPLLLKAISLLHSIPLAEEAVQDAFIRILKNLDKICENDRSKTWHYMVVVVTNVSFSILKKDKPSIYHDMGKIGMDEIEDYAEPIWSEYQAKELYQMARDYVNNNLDEIERQILILRSGHDMSYKEIADIVGITESNVSAKLSRLRKKMKIDLSLEEASL